ncbi:hypothetical protein EXU57_16700 [Segetibacter sp. 3557_3]|uniref:hypothetical protein n=1 Tax=Segetibacter sp. 3557_3 TaxID=2547429 RepID=UPI0010591034|nr:hypothetical protein [Segetibacter sp. 3557_3]TDH23448.1 hypothetical protein EXU57_16700 [Segetibacter sp. 3557_3]
MEDKLTDIILRICEVLNSCSVRYMIVGGSAVALHGFFRWSQSKSGTPTEKFDLDVWYDPMYPNYFNLLSALEALGEDVSEFRDEQSPDPHKSFFKFEYEEFTLDFLPSIGESSKFRNSYDTRDLINVEGIEIPFINREDLIVNKERQGRPIDLEDVSQLKKLRKSDSTDDVDFR